MDIIKTLNNKDWSLLIYTFLCERTDSVIPTEEVGYMIQLLCLKYGMNQNQLLDKIIKYYGEKEKIGQWKTPDGKHLKYVKYAMD